jgi:hypothetical protein
MATKTRVRSQSLTMDVVQRSCCETRKDKAMLSPEPALRIIGRFFRTDGDHITDLTIPAFNCPVDVVLGHSRVFQYKGTQAPGEPVYFEASRYTVPEAP